jgi:hypothetical protein
LQLLLLLSFGEWRLQERQEASGSLTMNQYVQFMAIALCNGVIAMTLTKAVIFHTFRQWLVDKSNFIGELIQCPYCTSHWIAAVAMVIWHPRFTDCGFLPVDYIATGFALTALSSMVAGIVYRLFAD